MGSPPASAWLAVAIGGFLGTELRYGLGFLLPEAPGAIPVTTLCINVSGSFVLAFLTTYWRRRPATPFWLRAGIGPGVLGSFTTFSAVTLALVVLPAGSPWTAASYLVLSLSLGLLAAAGGWILGRSSLRGTTP